MVEEMVKTTTMRVDEDTHQKIKIEAAKQRTSMKNLLASIVAVQLAESEEEDAPVQAIQNNAS